MLTVVFSLFYSIRQGLRNRAVLQAEILALRHQLLVLQRSNGSLRPRLSFADRILWVWLSQLWSGWRRSTISGCAADRFHSGQSHDPNIPDESSRSIAQRKRFATEIAVRHRMPPPGSHPGKGQQINAVAFPPGNWHPYQQTRPSAHHLADRTVLDYRVTTVADLRRRLRRQSLRRD